MAQRKSKAFKFGAASAIIVLALAYLGWTGYSESKSYYVTIPELHKMGDQAYSRHLRVGGTVEPGSIHQVGTNADFMLVEIDPKTNVRLGELRVSYKGIEPPPDTFKDNSQALAIGDFGHDGVFHAKELQAKCASKYAPQQQQNGAAAQPQSKGY
jgi:cytochrome c-type biogenesis protein CcmE